MTSTYPARKIKAGHYEYRGYYIYGMWNALGDYWMVTQDPSFLGTELTRRYTLRDAKRWIDRHIASAEVTA